MAGRKAEPRFAVGLVGGLGVIARVGGGVTRGSTARAAPHASRRGPPQDANGRIDRERTRQSSGGFGHVDREAVEPQEQEHRHARPQAERKGESARPWPMAVRV